MALDPTAILSQLDGLIRSVDEQQKLLEKQIELIKAERKELADERSRLRDERKAMKKLYKRAKQAQTAATTPKPAAPATLPTAPLSSAPLSSAVPASSSSPAAAATTTASSSGPSARWFFSDDSNMWTAYPADQSRALETAFASGATSTTLPNYTINLPARTQTRTSTGKVRSILRGTWFWANASGAAVPFSEADAATLEAKYTSGSFPVTVSTSHGSVMLKSSTSMSLRLRTSSRTSAVRRGTGAPPSSPASPSAAETAAPFASYMALLARSAGADADAAPSASSSSSDVVPATVKATLPGGEEVVVSVPLGVASEPPMLFVRKQLASRLGCAPHLVDITPWLDNNSLSSGATLAATASVATRTALFSVTVKTLAGEVITLDVTGTDDVLRVKQLVQLKKDLQPPKIRFIFGGLEIDDHRCLSDYGITADSILHLVVRL